MAMGNFQSPVRRLHLYPNEVTPSGTLGTSVYDLTTYGFSLANPHDLAVRWAAEGQTLAHGEKPLADGYLTADDLVLRSGLYDADNFTLWSATMKVIQRELIKMAGPTYRNKHSVLRIGRWNGSALVYQRRYVRFISMVVDMVQKTEWRAAVATIRFRGVDPLLYAEPEVSVANGGTSPVAITVAAGEVIEHKRIYYKIIRASGTITAPTVTNTATGETFTVSGSISGANEFWYIDPYSGRLIKGTGTIEAAADEIANFSGRFMPRAAAEMPLSIAFTGGGNATFEAVHLNSAYI
jgi:hypothetical protein